MRTVVKIILGIALLGLVVMSALSVWVFGPTAAPSGEMTAIPVGVGDVQVLPTEAQVAAGGATTFELVQGESQARFLIDEILSGNPFTVVGTASQVAGQILIDPANPAATQIGPITVNARTIATDNGSRNRAIQNAILQTGAFEFITFTPKQITGLPASVAIGDTFSFQVVGDLQIKDVLREVTFDVSVTVESESTISGLASATILRDDFGLGLIQTPPQVASVAAEVILELEFAAAAQ